MLTAPWEPPVTRMVGRPSCKFHMRRPRSRFAPSGSTPTPGRTGTPTTSPAMPELGTALNPVPPSFTPSLLAMPASALVSSTKNGSPSCFAARYAGPET